MLDMVKRLKICSILERMTLLIILQVAAYRLYVFSAFLWRDIATRAYATSY